MPEVQAVQVTEKIKTNWPLLVLIVLMPLRNIQLQYIPNLGGGLNFINVMFLLALGHAWMYGRPLTTKPPINGFLVWYILSSIIALMFGYSFLGDGAGGLWKTLKDALVPVFLVFVIQRSAVNKEEWKKIFVATLLPLPYMFKVVWTQYRSVSSHHYSDDLRISGTFMDLGANEMGAHAVMLSLICLGCLISLWGNKKWRYIFIMFFFCSSLCVLYSYSRGGYISFLLGGFLIFMKFEHKKKLVFPLILAITIGMFNLPKSVEERFSSINSSEEERDESAQSRFVFWAVALEKYLERPVFGFGYLTVQDKRINPHEMDTHNYYVKVIVERGIVGIVTFLILLRLFWRLPKDNIKNYSTGSFEYGLMLGFGGALAAMMLGNMFGDRFSHYPIATSLWVYVALVSILDARRIEMENQEKQNKIQERQRLAL